MSERAATATAGRRPRPARLVALAVLLLLAGLAVWGVLAARSAAQQARAAQDTLQNAVTALGDGDLATASAAARDASRSAAGARADADALPLRLVQPLPFVGADVRAARVTLAATDDALRDGVVPLVEAGARALEAQQAAPPGAVDVESLAGFAEVAARAAGATSASREQVDGLRSARLRFLGGQVTAAGDGLRELDDKVGQTDRALRAVLPALGTDRPRTYLVAAQNLAEARPTGGIIGSWALVTVDRGTVQLSDVGVNDDLEQLVTDLPDLPDEVEALYGPDLGLSQNVNLSPDAPTAAGLLVRLWTQQGRAAPDGVVLVDPVALARVLDATGPVQPPVGGPLDGDNLVDVVQQEVYSTYAGRNDERTAYLGVVTASVFQALVAADWSDPGLRRSLGAALREQHVQLWSADPGTQDLLVGLGVAGALDAPDPRGGTVRVHLTNADASKLDHFLTVSTGAGCSTAGEPQVRVVLASDPPDRLPEYSRSHLDGLAPRDHRLIVALYVPPTRGLAGLAVDGRPNLVAAGNEQGWTVVRAAVDVPADGAAELVWTLSGPPDVPQVHVQPLTRPAEALDPTAGGAGGAGVGATCSP